MEDAALSRADAKPTAAETAWEYVRTIFIAFVIVFGFIRPFVFEIYKIPSGSMEDTLLVGDRVIVSKFNYGVKLPGLNRRLFAFHKPDRGDVFVFTGKHEPETHFIKRVVAVEGDAVETRNRDVYIDGHHVMDETFTKHIGNARGDFPPFQLPLAPYYHEEPGIREAVQPFTFRTPVEVQTADGVPVAYMERDGIPVRVRVERRLPEFTRRIPVKEYFEVLPMDGRRLEAPSILYYHPKEKQWHLVEALPRRIPGESVAEEPFVIPPDHVFAMGDNRENSVDSRFWGPVPFENVKGKAVLVIWSTREGAGLFNGLRLRRTGMIIRNQYGVFASEEASATPSEHGGE